MGAWKDYEKEHGALSGVELARRVEDRIGRSFDDSMLSKLHRMKRWAAVDEHYALAAELKIAPDLLAGPLPNQDKKLLWFPPSATPERQLKAGRKKKAQRASGE